MADATTSAPAIHAMPNAVPAAVPNTMQAAAQRPVPGERVFHNPYRTPQRPQPVNAAVTELWTPRARTTQQEQARHIARDLEQRTRTRPTQPEAQVAQVAQGMPATQPVQAAQTSEAQGTTSYGALGLFQDTRPDVRSLFTHGVRG